MVDEPDNLVLALLRELRGRFDQVDKRFDALEGGVREVRRDMSEMRKDMSEMRTWTQLAIGMGMTNQLKSSELEARIAALEKLRPQ